MVNLGGQSHHAVSTTLHTLLHSDWKAISLHSTMLQGWSVACWKSETASQRINKLWIPSEACKPFFTSSSYAQLLLLYFPAVCFDLFLSSRSTSVSVALVFPLPLSVVVCSNFPEPPRVIPTSVNYHTNLHTYTQRYLFLWVSPLPEGCWMQGGRPQHETKMWVSLTGAGWSGDAAGDKPPRSISGSVTVTCWKVICKSALENRTPFVSLQLSLSLYLYLYCATIEETGNVNVMM